MAFYWAKVIIYDKNDNALNESWNVLVSEFRSDKHLALLFSCPHC